MNIMIVGSAYPALQKTMDWLNQTEWLISRIAIAEERASKIAYVFEKAQSQPHTFSLENVSIVPDGRQNKRQEFRLGRAMDINLFIKCHFPDGRIDYLFFCVDNDKADLMLDQIDPAVHTVGKYFFLEAKGYES
jgi:hypothetical protein